MIRTVFKKELTDGFRDRRSLFSALFFGPLFGPVVFAAVLTTTLKVEEERAEKPIEIPINGAEHAPNLVGFLEMHGVRCEAPIPDPVAAVESEAEDLVLVIPAEYGAQLQRGEPAEVTLVLDRSRRAASAATSRLRHILQSYGRQIGRLRLQVRGVDPSVVDAVVVAEKDLSTPQSRGALILAMLPYLMMMAVFIGSMYLAIDSTAGERERRSLEPLLVNPVPRWKLMTGKLLATTVLGVVSLTLTVTAFAFSVRFVPAGMAGLKLNLDPGTSILIFLVMLPITLIAASLQMIIAAFTKSFREAQTYVSLLLLVPMVPSFALMLVPVKTKLWMTAVPMLSQNLLIEKLVRGEGLIWRHFGVAEGSTILVGILLATISAGLYRREALLFTE